MFPYCCPRMINYRMLQETTLKIPYGWNMILIILLNNKPKRLCDFYIPYIDSSIRDLAALECFVGSLVSKVKLEQAWYALVSTLLRLDFLFFLMFSLINYMLIHRWLVKLWCSTCQSMDVTGKSIPKYLLMVGFIVPWWNW